ncbi:DEAD/DEAH box helicase [Candidatus Kaiserbacteria bacterium]|nr:DEAD/DEAH box helicase [Candidatus Kaiserbacteria bacterium]
MVLITHMSHSTGTEAHTNAPTFQGLGIAPEILAIIDKLRLTSPTPIQHQAIPAGVEGRDVVGIAQTGTGKTLAFGIPVVQRLAVTRGKALILLPTRELALQVYESLGNFARPLGLRGAVLIGGASMNIQVNDLRRSPNIIIATPGRLIDHLQQGTIRLDGIEVLVLDEADRMLDMGFWPQIKQIIAAVPTERQTFAFSATLSREIMDLATKHMKTPVSIEVSPPGTTAERVSQEFFIVPKQDKVRLLESVLSKNVGSTIVFTRTKHGASRIMRQIKAMGHTAAEIHSNRSLSQRRLALEGFKKGSYRVLVATDIAARGIDVKGIELVVNYDLPSTSEDYVHRIGRTARAGAEGHAISFAEPSQRREIRDIERLIRMSIPLSQMPDLPPSRSPMPIVEEGEERRFRSRRPFPAGSRASFGRGPRRESRSFARPRR